MNPPPSSRGPRAGRRRNLLRRAVSLAQGSPRRSAAIPVGLMALVLTMGHGTALKANEGVSVRRGGEVGQFDPVPIDSLPTHRPLRKSGPDVTASPVAKTAEPKPAQKQAALDRAIRQMAILQSMSESEQAAAVASDAKSHSKPKTSSSSQSTRYSEQTPRILRGKLSRGESISTQLRAQGISAQMVRTIDRTIRPEFDFRRSQPGDSYRLSVDSQGELLSFRYRASPDETVVIRQSPRGYRVEREAVPLRPKLARMRGTVESSLYKSIRVMGHDPGLASAFADIFAWDIDFTRQLKRGDGFTILYEKLYREEDGEQVYVRPGRILAARFDGNVGEHTAVYFEEENGIGSYFRPDGGTLEQEYLVAPLKYGRISSNYSAARNHPILKVVRPHHGIDYAARTGTPLWSVADGSVIFKGVNGGFGNLVKIRHASGYVSYYAHLSAFSPGLKVGQKVSQQQVIGYVGQTGLATGPHVCFRVTKHGKYVNPSMLNRRKPVSRSVADASWSEFELVRDQLLADLQEGRPSAFAGNAL